MTKDQCDKRMSGQGILFSDGESPSDGSDLVPLYPDDMLVDLQRDGLRLLQKKGGFRLGTDSVLLAAYAASQMPQQRAGKIADLGAGCGALSILLAGRLPKAQITGFEIDPASCATLARNIRLNHLQARVQVCCCDLAGLTTGQADLPVPAHSFDVALSNPPYRRPDGTADRARTEDALPLDALLRTAGLLLKPRGRLFLVHRASRLPEVLLALALGGFAVRTLRLVQSLPGKPPFIFLLSATWQGKSGGFRAETPLILRHLSGSPSAEVADWYGHEIPLSPGQLRAGLTDQAIPAEGCGKEDGFDVR